MMPSLLSAIIVPRDENFVWLLAYGLTERFCPLLLALLQSP
jgi:hypothetical protein